ncbi:DUF4339 domain-containing protein [Bradyrhizobium sp. WSM4349]|uniref:DUF4339 domain-containing protein n=1 Tax=Bradyrhizobium sp. WSM4349 TaxID=1040988 RepID=UPI00036F8569|nr:DUF4339 domain-containing protein [Bradyrhizobium sp. WSM4349]
MADVIWHALIGDEEHGPMSQAQVLAYLRGGTLTGDDLVWRPGFEGWLPLREIQEFWRPPARNQRPTYEPAHQPAVNHDPASPSLPLQVAELVHQQGEKWSLWGAAIAGLVLSAATLAIGALTSERESYSLASYTHTPAADSIVYIFGYLSFAPLLFVLIAAIRNGVRGSKLLPPRANAAKRALIFLAVVISVVAALKMYGEMYFSRQEAISGAARVDIAKSFVSGCVRSQGNMATNLGATEAEIMGYCDCLAIALGSLTYKQIGMSNAMDYIKRAIEPAVPACRPKR